MWRPVVLCFELTACFILTSISFVQGVDVFAKLVSAIVAVAVGYYAIRHYRKRTELDDLLIKKENKDENTGDGKAVRK